MFEQGKGKAEGSYNPCLLNVLILFVLGDLVMHFIVRFDTWRISAALATILAFLRSTKRKMLEHIPTARHIRLSQKEEVVFLGNQVTQTVQCSTRFFETSIVLKITNDAFQQTK